MTCIYFSVSLKASGHESRILGESGKTYFFYPTSKTSTNLYGWTHCKSGSGYTGSLDHRVCAPIANGRDEMRLRRDNYAS